MFLKVKNVIYKFIFQLIFFVLHVSLFYLLLYKINGGMLSFYIVIFLILGIFSCHLLYFNDKKDWNIMLICYIITYIMEMV